MEKKHVTCVFCDQGCRVSVEVENGNISAIRPFDPALPAICSKPMYWESYVNHPDRVIKPLKNVGKRGEPKWQEMPWERALDEIAEKLKTIISKFGSTTVAMSAMPVNLQSGAGLLSRFTNLIGTPNYITPMELCVGNTAQVHRTTYGWYTSVAYEKSDCIVLFGQNRSPENWPRDYLGIMAAHQRGAKIIMVDPRKNRIAEKADYFLPLRYGTDAALLLGWLNVIIEEGLYDHEFVQTRTVGFEQLTMRVKDYSPERVAEITGIDAALIRETARVYANAEGAVIPWGVVTDMQKNSTSALRCQCILRAICGFIGKSEIVPSPGSGVLSISEIEMHEALTEEIKARQLGAETYPLFSYKGASLYKDASTKTFGYPYYNLVDGSCMAHPPTLFKAMRTGKPYPVKAMLVLGNNTLLSFANQKGILEAFMNQELVVAYENFSTPTAQLADYVLPGDMWLERPALGPVFDVAPIVTTSQQVLAPKGECKNIYDLIKGLADRMGLKEHFPWGDIEAFYDWRLSPLGMTWEQASQNPVVPLKPTADGTRFGTPSGKVELHSSILEKLGYDPLPYFKEPDDPSLADEYPLTVFVGLREPANYNTCLRQISELRKRIPEPLLLMNPVDIEKYHIAEGAWAWVETPAGKLQLMVKADAVQPQGTIRVPHGWWKPEKPQGIKDHLSDAVLLNDGMILSDEADNLDPEQGLPNLRGGVRAKVYCY